MDENIPDGIMLRAVVAFNEAVDAIPDEECYLIIARAMLDTDSLADRNPPTIAGKDSIMRKRFEYTRMTGQEFTADLKAIGMSVKAFARITGSIAERVQSWADGKEDIPTWVPIFTAVLENVSGALSEARQEAAERILRDLSHPERGEFPYLEREVDDDET